MQAFAASQRYLDHRAARDDPARLAAMALTLAPRNRAPEPADRAAARVAWRRFETVGTSGLAAAGAGAPVSCAAMARILIATVAAARLGLLPAAEAEERLSRGLRALAGIELNERRLPGLWYRGGDLRPCDRRGGAVRRAAGWSATGILRLVAAFLIVARHHPALATEAALVMNRWHLGILCEGREFLSQPAEAPGPDEAALAARTARLVGLTPPPRGAGGRADPASLLAEAMEFGWREGAAGRAARMLLALRKGFERDGTLRAPRAGAQEGPALATGSGFAWQALMPTPFSRKLRDALDGLETETGWREGRGSDGRAVGGAGLATNAAVLEALHYRAFGPLFN